MFKKTKKGGLKMVAVNNILSQPFLTCTYFKSQLFIKSSQYSRISFEAFVWLIPRSIATFLDDL